MNTGQSRARRTVAVLFGGRSLEHDVSVVSGLQVLHALDPEEFDPIPVYVDQHLRLWTGDALWQREAFGRNGPDRARVTEVCLDPGFGSPVLTSVKRPLFGRPRAIPIDVFLPILHGTFGEDGSLQGLLEMSGAAYVGSGVLASAAGMNKRVSKALAQHAGVPVVPWLSCERRVLSTGAEWIDALADSVEAAFSWPVIVKPCNLGSSAGVTIVRSAEELVAAVLTVFEYDSEALIEPFITKRLELNVAVAGLGQNVASVSEMPVTSADSLLDFEKKYKKPGLKGVGTSDGMATAVRILDPVDLPADVRREAQQLAVRVFSLLGCEGIARIDFLIDTETDRLYFNEINTVPGSLAYYLWSAAPHYWTLTELLSRLIRRAEHIRATKRGLQRQPPPELQLLR